MQPLEPGYFRIHFHAYTASSFKTQRLPTVFQCLKGRDKSLQSNKQHSREILAQYWKTLDGTNSSSLKTRTALSVPQAWPPLVPQDSATVRRLQTFLCVVVSSSVRTGSGQNQLKCLLTSFPTAQHCKPGSWGWLGKALTMAK